MLESTSYASPYTVAAQPADVRATFIKKTYAHLGGAIGLFAILEYFFLRSQTMLNLVQPMMGNWWMILIGFMGISWLANKWATSNTSLAMQYAGLGLYVVAQAIIFIPLLYMAIAITGSTALIGQAGIITAALTVGVTAIAFITKKDFSFLNSFLMIGGFIALGLIFSSMIFGFNLGLIFSAAMAIFASVAILRDTSNIIHKYGTEQYVAASLGLFASIALLFWYVIQILMSLAGRD
ncbi:Bax inhibitor-1/YccA family protein [Rubritalea profundi]|uniref:Permease n=1 Tax=Rubritalea profundi TaxID=1658618 RepID=A0A2S7TY42_9BACT|nr:Bax inhibitor-1 family protein [Rubritalea profundi]PQJ27044.1 permease [Rubritalea profundi]